MNKKLKDFFTAVAFYIGISTGITISSYWLGLIVIFFTSVAFFWSLDKNVEYGYRVAKEEENGV